MNLRERIPDACFFACPANKFRHLQEQLDVGQADVTKAEAAGVSAKGCDILRGHVQALEQKAKQLVEGVPENADGPWHVNYAAEGIPGTPSQEMPHCCRFAGVVLLGKGTTVKN